MTINKKITTAAILFSLGAATLGAQTLAQAKKWFENGKFEKAKPVFKKLVKQSPSNAGYNFWYGACCYETGELKQGLPYLEKSAKRKYIDGYLYVSKAYSDLYRYDEAIENINQHIYWLKQKKRNTSEAEELLSKYRKGARMLRSTEMVTVIDSFTIEKEKFLDAYKLSSQAGVISLISNGYASTSPNTSIIDSQHTEFVNEMGDKKLLSEEDENGTSRLYSSVKLIDKWSKPRMLKGLDENGNNLKFPFLNSDGTTLYFAAKGEESLGGYDIFITRADTEENKYFKPSNLGYPFNSKYNDYMYAIDDYNNLGWFASDRFQPEGMVCVYVFIPNESKETYNYETEDPGQMISLAKLDNISLTQRNKNEIIKAKQRLAKVMYSTSEKEKKETDFTFIVNDNKIYHTLKDFSSAEARKLFQQMAKMGTDLKALETELAKQRETYHKATSSNKESMAPGIIDKEKRVEQLRSEIDDISLRIRNAELSKR